MKQIFNREKGFTLVEIMVTTTIVGTLAAISIPSFMAHRMNANMELVKQQMRMIGEKMTEAWTKNGQFPDPNNWPFSNSADPNEQAVTANLSAIDNLCYTTDKTDYVVSQNRSSYSFRTCPKTDACGKQAGNKCFLVHSNSQLSTYSAPGVVMALDPSNSLGVPMTMYWDTVFIPGPDLPNAILSRSDLNEQQKVSFLAAYLEDLAYELDAIANDSNAGSCAPFCNGAIPYSQSSLMFLPDGGIGNLSIASIFDKAMKQLQSKGIQLYQVERNNFNQIVQTSYDFLHTFGTVASVSNVHGYEVAFKLNDRVETLAERQGRSAAAKALLDQKFHDVRCYYGCNDEISS